MFHSDCQSQRFKQPNRALLQLSDNSIWETIEGFLIAYGRRSSFLNNNVFLTYVLKNVLCLVVLFWEVFFP